MRRRHIAIGTAAASAAACLLSSLSHGCIGTLAQNQLVERAGNITVLFINNTPYRAAFTYGTYDDWDRSPGEVDSQQLILEANTTSSPATLACGRDFGLATDALANRIIATEADQANDFNPDAFDRVVRFSSAPSDSDAATLPTAGTAVGVHRLLGVHYSCEDQLVLTFEEDPDSPGGFRVDYEVIKDDVKN